MTFLSRLGARWRLFAFIGVLFALGVGYVLFGSRGGAKASMIATRADVPTQVSVVGTVQAASSADLGFAQAGRIAGTYAAVGDHVAAGTVLAETENGDLRAAVDQKQAALGEAQANLDALLAGTRPEEVANDETSVAQATQALSDAAQSAYAAADDAVRSKTDVVYLVPPVSTASLAFTISDSSLETNVENERSSLASALLSWKTELSSSDSAAAHAAKAEATLAAVTAYLNDLAYALTKAVPSATITTYQADVASARSSVTAAASALTTAETAYRSATGALTLAQAGSTPEDIAAGRASVAAALADLESARAALAKTQVVAPFTGIVTKMDAKEGEIVSPSDSQISMQSDGTFEIEVYVPEVAISGVSTGQAATTTLDAYGPEVSFPAKVIAVDPAETEQDGVPTYKTTLEFAKNDPRIRSGMTADVTITTGSLKDAIVIPAGAVGHDSAGAYVSVLTGKKIERRPVSTGIAPSLGELQVTAGLSGGETILLAPQ